MSRMARRGFAKWVPLYSALLIMSAVGCGGPRFSAKPPPPNVFRVPLDVPLMSLDPALVSDGWSIDTMQNTFEGLVAMGEDNQVHPGLAEKWEISKDGRVYTFHLKPGIKFQNGRLLVADDIKKSFERACSKDLASPLAANYLNDIVGFQDIRVGKTRQLSGVKTVDHHTVQITLDSAHPYFIAKLTCPVAFIVATDAIKDGLHITSLAEMVGTGPFRISKYVDGQLIEQAAFADYHGGRPKIDLISRPVMRDSTDRLNAFKRGEIDVIQQLARSDYVELKKDPQYGPLVKLIPKATLVYLALNLKRFPDRRVRQAIAMSIDRNVIADDYLFGTVTAAKGILPVGIPGYRRDPAWLAPGIGRAKELLAESGHARGAGLPELRIAFAMENPDIERIADQIGAQLREKLGLSVRLDKMESAALIERQNIRTLDCEVTGWFADYLDPQDFLSILLSSGSQENHWSYRNKQFDALCKEADSSGDTKHRMNLYAKAEDLALQDAVLIPICYWATPIIVGPRVKGLRSYSAQFLPYNSVSLKQ